jgi:hypothetical protein
LGRLGCESECGISNGVKTIIKCVKRWKGEEAGVAEGGWGEHGEGIVVFAKVDKNNKWTAAGSGITFRQLGRNQEQCTADRIQMAKYVDFGNLSRR